VLRLFITLFNLQGARRLAQLGYLTTFEILCQELFSKFFQTFSFSHSPNLIQLLTGASLRSAAALVSSSVILPLGFDFVKNFFRFFKSFSVPVSNLFGSMYALSSARLSYQTRLYLSTPFFIFFAFSFYAPISPFFSYYI